MSDASPDRPAIGPRTVAATLWNHFHAYRGRLVLLSALGVVGALLEAGVVVLIAALASLLTNGGEELSKTVVGIHLSVSRTQLCVIAISAVLVRALIEFAFIEMRSHTDASYDRAARTEVLDAFLDSTWELQAVEQAGGLQTTLVTVIIQTRNALRAALETAVALSGLVVMLVASTAIAGWAALVVIAVLTGAALLVRPLLRSAHQASSGMWSHSASFATRIEELVGLAREIRVFDARDGVEREAGEDIDGLSNAVFRSEAAAYRLTAVNNNLIYLAAVGGLVALIAAGVDNPQPYIAMVLLLYRAVQYGRTLQTNYQGVLACMPYVDKLDEQLARYHAAARPRGTEVLEAPLRSVRFEQVSFAYHPGRPALEHIDFELTAGEAIGVVGPSGSGKSTLQQLLLGLRQPDQGRVLVNGRRPEDYSSESWASMMTLVPQDAHLFDRSVRDNIVCFRDGISDADVVEAARAAHVLDEIEALPDGFDTPIGAGGGRFSGGQRQRLCIARALAGRPSLLVLDEPTSALDLVSEEAIRLTLEGLRGQVTLVIIAHRMSTLRICDRVIVIDHGRIEAMGPRAELERDNRYYAEALRLAKLV
ncbi:MAG: ABC transporter ATP-binding protein [Acidimicrobiales bacterium]